MMLHRCGLKSDAQALCWDILQRVPGHFDSLRFLGESAYEIGQYEVADRLLGQALIVEPGSAAVHSNRGVVLHELKRFDEALTSCNKAIAIDPRHAEAFSNRGNSLIELGRFDEALASYEQAIAIKPDYADALSNRGRVLIEFRRLDDALASCTKAIAIDPNHANAFINRGNALMELHRFEEALTSYDKALAMKADLVAAWLGRGNACLNLGRFDDAFAAYSKALALKPECFKALAQLAWCYEKKGDVDEMIFCFDRALALKPDFAEAISNKILALDLAPNVDFAEQQEARAFWWQQIGSKISGQRQLPHGNSLDAGRRIVLGYVSADFRAHSAAYAFGPVLRNHDKTRFEIICYSCSTVDDRLTEDFRQLADKWRNVSQLSDDRLAELVRADKVDILIDLSGHTAGHRLGTFARKPAPVQVTAWGNAHGTGLPTIDYLFSDPVALPVAVRHCFAEKIYDLPCLVTVDRPAYELDPSDPPVLSRGYITFGVFNRITKISEDAVAAWARILRSAPQSRILIKDLFLDDESMRAALMARFAKHEIPSGRIDCMGFTPRREHLLAFNEVDICLDPFPLNGGVSTWEALHMGVPVVAKLGNSVPSRVAGAILSAIGMGEWVANSTDEYSAIALNYASRPDDLKELRREIPERISMSAAGNAVHYTEAVEQAYRTMWEDHCKRRS